MTSTHATTHGSHANNAPGAAVLEPNGGEPAVAGPAIPAVVAAKRIDRRVWLAAAVIVGSATLLAAGVPASTLLLFGVAGACVGMHLFMGHGGHGGHGTANHASHGDPGSASPDHDPATSPRGR